MTRFARAKGSKASNERVPEDATPWSVMKEQLQRAKEDAEHATRHKQAEQQRLENYEKFLNERKTAKRKSTWCEFPEEQTQFTKKNSVISPKHVKDKRDDKTERTTTDAAEVIPPKKKKKQKNSPNNSSQSIEIQSDCVSVIESSKNKHTKTFSSIENNKIEGMELKKKKKKKQKRFPEQNENYADEKSDAGLVIKNNDKHQIVKTAVTKEDKIQPQKKKMKQEKKRLPEHDKTDTTDEKASLVQNKEQSKPQKKKNKRDGPKIRRKPETHNSFQIIINGREVELVRFEGFPVMKKDAERLQQLRKDMTTKGIPKREIDRTMKLERRRAEKALARVKRDVCYNCRKGGHNISSCPDLRSIIPDRKTDGMTDVMEHQNEMADGICFKCGSTEHRQSECRVQKGQQFRFASCFICKEQGHIARQCPDNPKGLYPNGGACKLCGDVTHLRKDCPTTMTSKEESSVRLDTLVSNDNIEDVAQSNVTTQQPSASKKPKKIQF